MSDSSDDEPLAFRKSKLVAKENGQSKRGASDGAKATQETDKSSGQPAEDSEAPYKTSQEEPTTEPETKKKAPVARRPAAAEDGGGTRAATGKKGANASRGVAKADKPTPVKREKKVFKLPGQRRDTPDEMDPLRKFYSSLKKQKPESFMARNWLCIHGLLSMEEAEAHLRETGKAGLSSPGPKREAAKPRAPRRTTTTANPPAARKPSKAGAAPVKRKREGSEGEASSDDDDDDEDFMAKRKPAAKRAPPAKPAARKRVNRDVAFDDGGLDSDSDDDKPLAFRQPS